MSGQTISSSETRIEALQLQSSAYGVTIPVVWGVNRIAGNLVWYNGFKTIPHTTTQSGKGGGVKTQNTTFTYQASVAVGLCEGPIYGVPRVWRGKKLYDGGAVPTQIVTVTDSFAHPGTTPFNHTLSHAADLLGIVSVTHVYGEFGEYEVPLVQGRDYTVNSGELTFYVNAIPPYGDSINVRFQWANGYTPQTALNELGLSFKSGTLGQAPWAFLESAYPAESLGYSGLALVTGQDYDLGTGAQVENHLFEVHGRMAYHLGPGLPDVDLAAAMLDMLTNEQFGAGFPASSLDTGARWSNYCVATGLLMSPALEEQAAAADVLKRATDITNTAIVWSDGKVKMIPYGDTVQTGNGATYTPDVTPIYDLTDDDFRNLAEPVKVKRTSTSDAYNHVRVEFRSRGEWTGSTFTNQYAPEIAEAKDQANIDTLGLRTMPTIVAHWICDPAVANRVAHIILARALYIRNTYEFKLGWSKALLEPMDLVTITDGDFVRLPVRLTQVDESGNDFDCIAEDFPLGVATSTLYPSQSGAGFQANYNASPGSVDTPVFFEAPVERTLTGLEVYAAVKGSGALWGGCSAWVSLDGTNYRKIATLYGPARYGSLTGPIASGNLPVSTSGQLLSGSATDAAALSTLCYIGGATPEYLAYQTAALTGPGAYTLSGLVRGAYGSSQASAHATADPFVRVDDSVAKSGDLDLSYIGRTIYFKFTSFNVYGAAEESLADVSPYSYVIAGTMVSLPPSQPTGGTAVLEPFGLRVSVNLNPEPDVVAYEWRQGTVWASATVLEENGGTSYLMAVQTVGTFNVLVAARDALGIYSPPLLITANITGPVVNSFSSSISGPNLNLVWEATATAFAIAGYEVRHGASWASGTFAQELQSNRYTEIVRWGGARTYWVAAFDGRGNYGTPVSLAVFINAPGAVQSQRAEVVDNNALLFWQPPLTGDLPFERYEVRKGATWAGGTVVGSNGNSTFAAVFEQQAGNYTYWITAYDSAGNAGTPAAITATINQPPDYILRSDINSALAGTLVNMYLEDGKLYGPVDTTQTFATHFTSRGWSTPDDQIAAGYPIFVEPSTTSGSYEEQIDYGVVLPATVVTATLSATVLDGSVVASCTLSYKVASGDSWTVATAGLATIFAAGGFRYLRVHYDFTCTAGANLIEVSGINIKVANKLKTDSGTFTITNANAGVWVDFNVPFLDADTPIAQANGTTPLVEVVDFSDVPNPTGFTVYLHNLAGTKVTGSGSWNAQGS